MPLGTIIAYSQDAGAGLISSDEGEIYRFVPGQWIDADRSPQRNDRVRFEGVDFTAKNVQIVTGAGEKTPRRSLIF